MITSFTVPRPQKSVWAFDIKKAILSQPLLSQPLTRQAGWQIPFSTYYRRQPMHDLEVEIPKQDLLTKLRENRARHGQLFKDATDGFLKHARIEFETRLALVQKGSVKNLSVSLQPPMDHTSEYDTAIQMVEMHIGDTMKLSSSEFRTLVQDEWDWLGRWLHSNRQFSDSVGSYSSTKTHLMG
jgi:hypothetical protein